MRDVYVTLDIDWAPDAAVHEAADLLEAAGCRATWFVTHESEGLERLRGSELFELGIHPNFLPGSSHGAEPEEVLRNAIAVAPEARCVRTHSAVQSGAILGLLRDHPQLELDCSVMLPGMANATPVAYEDGVNLLWRVPNFWSDDYEAAMRVPSWELIERLSVPGVKVLIFHPIHVALNSSTGAAYERLREQSAGIPEASRATMSSLRHSGPGAASALREVAEALARTGGGASLSGLIPETASRSAR